MLQRKTKTYPAVTGPGTPTDAICSENPTRLAIFVQNTGANPGILRFGTPTQQTANIAVAAGAWFNWDQADTSPQEAVFVQSQLATTWTIMETVRTS